jgi:hypothetical protein
VHNAEGQDDADEQLIASPLRRGAAAIEPVDEADGNRSQPGRYKHNLLSAAGLHNEASTNEGEDGSS